MFYRNLFILTLFFITYNNAYADNSTCTHCKQLIDFITYEFNHNNSTIHDLISLIKDICARITGPGARECSLIIDNVDKIIDLISNNTNSTQICKDIFLC